MSFNLYKKDKLDNFDLMLIYKVGIFYEVYNEDAYILHYLTRYNIRKYQKYHRLGFPIQKLNAIKRLLENNNIGYKIEDISSIKKVIINSQYFNVLTKSIDMVDKEMLINMITNKLEFTDEENLKLIYFEMGIN